MKLSPTRFDPHVRALPAHYRHAVAIDLDDRLTLELGTSEALHLADRIVDAAEEHTRSTP